MYCLEKRGLVHLILCLWKQQDTRDKQRQSQARGCMGDDQRIINQCS